MCNIHDFHTWASDREAQKGDRPQQTFGSVADIQTIAQTYLKPSTSLVDNAAWSDICALARLNLMMSFVPGDALDTGLFLPEIFHVLTLLAGSGSLLMRQTIYGLFVNIIQSLASSSPTAEMDGTALQQALDKTQSDQIIACFDLVEIGGSMESATANSGRDDSDVGILDHVGILARFLGDVLVSAAPNLGKYLSTICVYQCSDQIQTAPIRGEQGGWDL